MYQDLVHRFGEREEGAMRKRRGIYEGLGNRIPDRLLRLGSPFGECCLAGLRRAENGMESKERNPQAHTGTLLGKSPSQHAPEFLWVMECSF